MQPQSGAPPKVLLIERVDMDEHVPGILRENLLPPEARNGAVPPPPICNGMEMGSVGVPLHDPILAALLLPEQLLTL